MPGWSGCAWAAITATTTPEKVVEPNGPKREMYSVSVVFCQIYAYAIPIGAVQ